MLRLALLVSILLCFATSVAQAAHTQVQILWSAETARPGDTVWAGVDLKMDDGWHTYWKNPGAAGLPTKIEWQLPPGITAGEIQWPLPEIIPPAEVTTYGYAHEVMLLVPITLGASLKPGPLVLTAKVSWLECKEECVPGGTNVETTLNIGSKTTPSADAGMIAAWRDKMPRSGDDLPFKAAWEAGAADSTRPLLLELSAASPDTMLPVTGANFLPDASDDFEVQAAVKMVSNTPTNLLIRKPVKKFSGDWPNQISGVMILEHNGSREGFTVKLPVHDQIKPSGAPDGSQSQPLWKMLFYALIGGLILNIMPCVLPVIALKVLGFVNEAGSSPKRVRALGGIYAVGVLASFAVLAGAVIGIKAAGHLAGWGMQFGSPIFLVCLVTLVTLVALNLFGVFEVAIGGRALDAAGHLASRHGAPGAFFNGVLATALATPCTAPILGTALGFAFAQDAAIILLIFLTVGLGLALPYLILCWNPGWLKFLPKPGAWMEKFKIAMGFPMLAAAVWLFNIAASTYGKSVLWLGLFLVILAFAAWLFGEFVQHGRKRKGLVLTLVIVLLAGGYAYALEHKLNWRAPYVASDKTGSLKESANGIDWQRWSPEAVLAARNGHHPVLVDFTADWCLTCQLNKNTSLEIPSVRKKLTETGAVAFVGDYTHTPSNITAELNRFGRAGVPLVLVYPKDPDAQPIVLPEVLTPGIVLDALDRAAR